MNPTHKKEFFTRITERRPDLRGPMLDVLFKYLRYEDTVLERLCRMHGRDHCDCEHRRHMFSEYDSQRDETGKYVSIRISQQDFAHPDDEDPLCRRVSKTVPYPTNCRFLPCICGLSNLRNLSFDGVNFSKDTVIPSRIGRLSMLTDLTISHTYVDSIQSTEGKGITGSIPRSIAMIPNLERVNFQNLCLSSSDITPLLRICSLTHLILDNIFQYELMCDLTDLEFNLPNLECLTLSSTFTGTLPNSLTRSRRLKTLNIYYCFLKPEESMDVIGQFRYLEQFSLNKCFESFYDIGSFDFNFPCMKKLSFSGKKSFIGSIPPSVSNMVNLDCICLNSKWICGPVPLSLFTIPTLTTVVVMGGAYLDFTGEYDIRARIDDLRVCDCKRNKHPVVGGLPISLQRGFDDW